MRPRSSRCSSTRCAQPAARQRRSHARPHAPHRPGRPASVQLRPPESGSAAGAGGRAAAGGPPHRRRRDAARHAAERLEHRVVGHRHLRHRHAPRFHRLRPAPTPEDVLYPVTVADSKGRTLNSDEDYVLHFEKGQLPPANAFWSLHVYNSQHGFAANPANRYAAQHRRPEVQRRRFAGRVHPAPRPRRAQARELAERAGLRWPVPVEHAPVLAAGPGADGLGARRCDATEALAAQAGRAPRFNAARVFLVVAGSCARFGWGLEARGWAPLRGDFGWDES